MRTAIVVLCICFNTSTVFAEEAPTVDMAKLAYRATPHSAPLTYEYSGHLPGIVVGPVTTTLSLRSESRSIGSYGTYYHGAVPADRDPVFVVEAQVPFNDRSGTRFVATGILPASKPAPVARSLRNERYDSPYGYHVLKYRYMIGVVKAF
jgi:hypothetical protein